MKVIMLRDVRGVGQRHTVIDANDGYAINYLIPQGLAEQATPDKIASLEKRQASEKAAGDAKAAQLSAAIRLLEGREVSIPARTNDHGHLFRAIKREAIAKEIGTAGSVEISPDMIEGVEEGIKEAGAYDIVVRTRDASARIRLIIAQK